MDMTFAIGVAGALALVAGAAWPDRNEVPVRSVKDWLLAIGGFVMLVYSYLLFRAGGPVFFVFLELYVNIASVFMMVNVRDSVDGPIMTIAGLFFILVSLWLFEGLETLFFIIGLCGIALGYVLQTGTFRRSLALALGSGLIAVFSYVTGSWVFFWLNVFFAIFSLYYAWQMREAIAAYIPVFSSAHRTRRRTRM